MRRPVLIGLGVAAGALAAGLVASRSLGSRPDEPRFPGPLPTCGAASNCFRARQAFASPPAVVHAALEAAVQAHDDWFTGRALSVHTTDDGLAAVFRAGAFRDDVEFAVVPGPSGQTVLHGRSASRSGESDLGVNRARIRRLFRETADRLR